MSDEAIVLDRLRQQIEERRGDTEFMSRLRQRIEADQHVLDRLANEEAPDDVQRVPFLVEPGWTFDIFIKNLNGPSYRLLAWRSHDREPMEDWTWRFEHRCDRGGRKGLVICAPLLDAHRVTGFPIHVEPSILCPDCGTHGVIREGRWVDADSPYAEEYR